MQKLTDFKGICLFLRALENPVYLNILLAMTFGYLSQGTSTAGENLYIFFGTHLTRWICSFLQILYSKT
jgi:hypothetical protein